MVKGRRMASSDAVPGRKLGALGPDVFVVDVVKVEEEEFGPLASVACAVDVAMRCDEAVDSLEFGRLVKVRSIVAVLFVVPPPAEGFAGSLEFDFELEVLVVKIGPSGPQATPFSPLCSLKEFDFVGFRSKDSMAALAVLLVPLSAPCGVP